MERVYFLMPKNGQGRKTRTGATTQRRVWKCGHCRKQFSVLTNTIFHGTKISIRKWVLVLFDFCASKNSISAWEISRRYEVTNETAWHMLHRIREAMKMEPVAGVIGGAVRVDETRVAGEPKNRHKNDPRDGGRRGEQRGNPVAHIGGSRVGIGMREKSKRNDGEVGPIEFLGALLKISPQEAEKVRERTPGTRQKPEQQEGPTADYGE